MCLTDVDRVHLNRLAAYADRAVWRTAKWPMGLLELILKCRKDENGMAFAAKDNQHLTNKKKTKKKPET